MSTIKRMEGSVDAHPIVSRGEWLAQGVKLRAQELAQEKEFTSQRDRLAAARRACHELGSKISMSSTAIKLVVMLTT